MLSWTRHLFLGVFVPLLSLVASAGEAPDFTRDIRPILAENCLKCHGPDDKQRAAKLRLDTFDGATAESRGGDPVVTPGDPDDSLLIDRIESRDPDELMPPPATGKTLSAEQKELLRAWIASGAEYQPHWSFVRVERPAPAPTRDTTWPRNPIDSFVLARLEAEGLNPSPEADRATLLRRASLDLIGLPPSPEELQAFLDDPRTDAYEHAVDRLLKSPHFGERWARDWLDLARYADTQGYEKDAHREIWRYRDWVIDALNANMPFDDFTVQQLAGDLLPNATSDQNLATAFHRNTMTNTEGGTDNEEFRTAAVIDRVNTTATVWLGLTMACVQCHTHKYDPITHREYFQFYDFFNQSADADVDDEAPTVPTPTAIQARQLSRHEQALQDAVAEARAGRDAFDAEFAAWREALRAGRTVPEAGPWHVAGPFAAPTRAAGHATAFAPEEAPFDPRARFGEDDALRWKVRARLADAQAHTVEDDGVYYFARTVSVEVPTTLELRLGALGGAKLWHNGNVIYEEARARTLERPEALRLTLAPGENTLLLKLSPGLRGASFNFALAPVALPPDAVRALDQGEAPARLAAQFIVETPAYAAVQPAVSEALARVREYEAKVPRTPVMQELPEGQRRTTHIFEAGSFLSPTEPVTADTPAVLAPMRPEYPRNRLGLARWLVDRDNPLTARVTVNRFWEAFFGIGIVDTPDDFGMQGSLPTHPELLDWLAAEFMESGWDLKHLCKTIVTSAAYRQESRVTPEQLDRDPDNRLLARGPRMRLDAETLRDQALAVAGLLSPQLGGPSVKPPQPEGVWQVVYSGDQWVTSTGRDRYRRGVYTYWRRTSPHPAMVTFDAPSREVCTARRIRTNTPLQALVTLNDPAFIEAAQALARAVMAEAATPEAAIARAYARALLRAPRPEETARLTQLYHEAREHYAAQPEAAHALATNPLGELPAGCDTLDAAAWTAVCNVILNLDEFLTKR